MIEGARYVKGQKRTTAPVRLLCVVPEFWHRMRAVSDGDYYYQARYVWFTEGRRYGTKWKGSEEPKRLHPDDWWDYVYKATVGRVRLYIVAPNAGDFCTSTGFWVQMDRRRFSLIRSGTGGVDTGGGNKSRHGRWIGRFVTGGPPDIIHTACKEGSVCLVSLRNYTQSTWDELFAATGRITPEQPVAGRIDDGDRDCPVSQCIAQTRYMRNLISGWVERDCGGWRETAAQLSVSYWRRKFYDVKVCRHGDAKAEKLERSAGYGGRNEVWFYGDCGSSDRIPEGSDTPPPPTTVPAIDTVVHRCDITSQYPSLLATEEFPTQLDRVVEGISVKELESLTRYYGVIADATVRTKRPEYPTKRNGEPVYCTGTFRTTLVGPECIRAIVSGEVVKVYSAACYRMGRPLASYAAHLLAERQRCREQGDGVGESFVKSLSVAIGGKFSQRSTTRTPRPDVISPEYRWGPWDRTNPDLSVTRFVLIAGLAFEEVPAAGGSKLLSAVYCYLTAYGREQMLRIRDGLYPDVPYSQCTDGIWVGDTALSTLRRHGLSDTRTPGTLRLVSSHGYARWFTPNHYYLDGQWILSGYRHGARVETDLSVTEFRDVNPIRTLPFKPPMAIKRQHIKRTLVGTRSSDRIGPDGWLVPRVLNERV